MIDKTLGDWDLNLGLGYGYGAPEDRWVIKAVGGEPPEADASASQGTG